MDNLIKLTNDIKVSDRRSIAVPIMQLCRAITPQFYAKRKDDEVIAEQQSIELLTATIDNNTLAEMCTRAVVNYPKERSGNTTTYFDINYILRFYREAFNYIHCDSVEVGHGAELLESQYDDATLTVRELWYDRGEVKEIRCIIEKPPTEYCRPYSDKYFDLLYTELDNVKI